MLRTVYQTLGGKVEPRGLQILRGCEQGLSYYTLRGPQNSFFASQLTLLPSMMTALEVAGYIALRWGPKSLSPRLGKHSYT